MGENVFQMYGVYTLVGHLYNVLGPALRLFFPPVLTVNLISRQTLLFGPVLISPSLTDGFCIPLHKLEAASSS